MKWFALILLIIALSPAQQAAPACVVSSADVAASLVTAQSDPSRCLELPAGTYAIGTATAGAWLNITSDNFELRGAGMGKTILQITAPLTLTSDLVAIRLFGVGQRVHELTIALGSGHSGAGNLAGINVYGSGVLGSNPGRAERATIERVEVTGGYTATGAGGYGIGTFRGWDVQGGAQWVTIRDCYIHDSPSTGIGINSNANLILHNHIARVGASFYAHGIYAQGGYNVYDGNLIESVSGWSYHGWKKVPNLDASSDRFINNISLNPGSGHTIVSGGANTVISGNIFRNTNGRDKTASIDGPTLIENNIFDNVPLELNTSAGGSVVQGNRWSGSVLIGKYAISAPAPILIANNVIDMNTYTQAISVNGGALGTQILGNRITRTASTAGWMTGIVVNANDIDIGGNTISMAGGAILGTPNGVTGLRLHDNVLLDPQGSVIFNGSWAGVAYDNRIVGTFNSSGLVLRDNN